MSRPDSSAAENGAASPARPRRGALVLKLAVTAGLLGLLFWRIPLRDVASLIGRADIGLVVLAHVLFAASLVGSAFQWGLFLRAQGIRLPFRKLLGFYLVGLFFNNFLPANLGGDVVKVVDVARAGGTRGGAVAATLMDRAMGLLVLMMAATAGAWAMGDALPYPELRRPVYLASIAIACAFGVVLSRRLFAVAASAAARVRPRSLSHAASRLLGHVGRFREERRIFLAALAISIAVQALRIAVHYVCAVALGVTVSPVVFLLVVPAIAIAVTLPISLGGFGVREGVGVLLFGRVGVGAPEALAFELLSHLVAVAVSAAGGIVFAVRKRRA